MVREDLIDGAVTFLQDPSVSSAPLEQKVSFLRSKNLTQEEIDVSIARSGQPIAAQTSSPQASYSTQYQQAPVQYGGYQQPPYWAQPPPEAPRRDWRDWFIMATVVGGVGYAMYWTAKRYVYPLIAPPIPPQLEQDKASIDASFDKAFALLDQLATDTRELKDAEESRKKRLDQALGEVESVIGKMKQANEERESEAKRIAREIEEIREQIPLAIQREKETTDGRLKDLAVEMKSLKTLVGNRMGQGGKSTPSQFGSQAPSGVNGINGVNGASPAASVAAETNGTNGVEEAGEKPAPSSVLPDRTTSASPFGRTTGSKAQIPSWQLAAKKRSEEAKKDIATPPAPTSQDSGESGTPPVVETGV